MLKKYRSDFLFAQPSFLGGAARVLDISGGFDDYNSTEDPDCVAIAADWCVLGDDLGQVLVQEGVLDLLAPTA